MSKSKIHELNEKYHAASDVEKRRMTAIDAKAMVLAGKLKAGHNYRSMYPDTSRRYSDLDCDASVQEFIDQEDFKCQVCGMGALLIARVHVGNDCNVDHYDRIETDCANNFMHWPYTNWQDIERAYEGYDYDWEMLIPNDTDRLLAILDNIIESKDALFEPDKLPKNVR